MADNDASDKTEEPTGRKLGEATEKGQIPRSQEVNHWFMLGALCLVLATMTGSLGHRLVGAVLPFLERPHEIAFEFGTATRLLGELAGQVALALAPVIGVAVLAALAGSFLQHPPVVATEKLKPELSKISPLAGFGRIFSRTGLAEFVKGVLKVALVSGVGVAVLWPDIGRLAELVALDPVGALGVARVEILKLLGAVLAVLFVIAVSDILFQRFEHHRRLRMTRQEVRDEMKQSEGDPAVKGRIRAIRRERARQRMMTAVPTATVVVTNPTHFAVALRYEADRMEAPKVVAKGVDHLALRIRELAQENGVPIVENPPLARTLFAGCEVDQEIPVEHYKAVAEIIGYVMRQKTRAGAATRH